MSALPIRDDEWQAQRRTGIGGSEAASVVDLSPFCSAFELYQIKRGEAPAKEETEAMRWGTVLEAPIAEEYSRRTGRKLRRAPEHIRSAEHAFMFISVDRMIVNDPRGPGYYEGKALSGFTKLDEGLPEHIWLQVQHGLAVKRWTWGVVAMLIGGQRFEVREVERDDEAIALLIDAEREFMRRVELADPPPPSGLAATSALLKRMYPVGTDRMIFLESAEARKQAQRFTELQETAKLLKGDIAAIKQGFQSQMQDAETAVIPGWGKVTWKTITPKPALECDFERLQKERPEVFAQYVRDVPKKPYRRFMPHPLKTVENQEDEE